MSLHLFGPSSRPSIFRALKHLNVIEMFAYRTMYSLRRLSAVQNAMVAVTKKQQLPRRWLQRWGSVRVRQKHLAYAGKSAWAYALQDPKDSVPHASPEKNASRKSSCIENRDREQRFAKHRLLWWKDFYNIAVRKQAKWSCFVSWQVYG